MKPTTAQALRSWLLPAVLVLNGAMSLAIADRAAELRRGWLVWELRLEAQARLKLPGLEDVRPHRHRSKEGGDVPEGEVPSQRLPDPEVP